MMIRHIVSAFVGFAGGTIISGAVFAFITVIGIVPRFAQKTCTQKYVKAYEEAIILGGILGTLAGIVDFYFPVGDVIVALLSFFTGIFYGALAVSLAEVLKVIPILTRRTRIQQGMFYFILAIGIGKMVGTIVYYVVPGFFKMD